MALMKNLQGKLALGNNPPMQLSPGVQKTLINSLATATPVAAISNDLLLPDLSSQAGLIGEVNKNRQASYDLVEKIRAARKLIGFDANTMPIIIPNYWGVDYYTQEIGTTDFEIARKAREDSVCGGKKRKDFFNCVDNFNPADKIEFNLIKPSLLEKNYLNQQLDKVKNTAARQITENMPTADVTQGNTQNNTGLYIIGALILAVIAYLVYQLAKK